LHIPHAVFAGVYPAINAATADVFGLVSHWYAGADERKRRTEVSLVLVKGALNSSV